MSATRLYATRSHAPHAARPMRPYRSPLSRCRQGIRECRMRGWSYVCGPSENRDNECGSDASSAAVVLACSRGARSLRGNPDCGFSRFHSVIHASAPSLIPAAARHPYAAVHRPSSDFVKTGSAWAETAEVAEAERHAFEAPKSLVPARLGAFESGRGQCRLRSCSCSSRLGYPRQKAHLTENARARPVKCEILIRPGPHEAGRAAFGDAAVREFQHGKHLPTCRRHLLFFESAVKPALKVNRAIYEIFKQAANSPEVGQENRILPWRRLLVKRRRGVTGVELQLVRNKKITNSGQMSEPLFGNPRSFFNYLRLVITSKANVNV
ncbi:hypothetical protein GGX14DRAFT_405287 [Mycena pura]|uniref:Uncharacterized protein n=1 Tax=Mycena pura TaxID=153505 RepID=A0AAD6UU73_9AGAR|nr:hypothetical protein GGX14DRAFT_405287 [Mycena pura]